MKLQFLILLLSSFPLIGQVAEIRIAGSDQLGFMEEAVQTQWESKRGETQLIWNLQGSYPAMQDIQAGSADVAIVLLKNDSEKLAGFEYYPIGFRIAAILANKTNPIKQLSYDQLKAIFGSQTNSNISDWGQLGLSGYWKDRAISLHAFSDADDLSLDIFKYKVLGSVSVKSGMREWSSMSILMTTLRTDDRALAIAPFPVDDPHIQCLFVSPKDSSVGYFPTEESILFGDYNLQLPIYIVLPKDAPTELFSVAELFFDSAVQGLFKDHMIIQLPENERKGRQMMFKLQTEKLRGEKTGSM
jgi:ABC-type phosphate transport system substrate-binding protein